MNNIKKFPIITAFFGLILLILVINYAPILLHCGVIVMLYRSFQTSLILAKQALQKSLLKDPIFIPNKVYRNLAITLLTLYIINQLLGEISVSGFLAIAVGCIFVAKLKELHYWILLKNSQIQLYYLAQLVTGIGYLWLGFLQIKGGESVLPQYCMAIGCIWGGYSFFVDNKTKF